MGDLSIVNADLDCGIQELSNEEIDLVSGGSRIRAVYRGIREIVTWIGAISLLPDYQTWHDGFTERAHARGRRMINQRRCVTSRAVDGC